MSKPVILPVPFATLADYSLGPKVGNPTKDFAGIGAFAPNGFVPGLSFPTAGNVFNAHYSTVVDWSVWVSEGSSTADLTAHIIETTASGTSNIAALDLGDTAGIVTALTVRNNSGGGCVLVEPNNVNGIVIDPQALSGFANREPLRIETAFDGGFAHSMIRCHETAGQNSMGGILCEVATNNNFAPDGPNPKQVAAVNGYNEDGVAGEFRSNSPLTANASLKALNVSLQGVSAEFGFAEAESTTTNINGIACRAKGGPGNDGLAVSGGVGFLGFGGASGLAAATAGTGVWAIGGSDPGGLGSQPAMITQSNSTDGRALLVQHLIAAATANLAKFETGDNLANGIVVDCNGFGSGVIVNGEGGVGLVINQVPEGGGAISPALALTPQTQPLGASLAAGDMWSVSDPTYSTTHHLYFCSAPTVLSYVQRAQSAPCYARATQKTDFNLPIGTTSIEAGIAFHPQMQPIDGVITKITVWGTVLMGLITDSEVTFTLTDTTGAPVIIFTHAFRAYADGATRQEVSVTTAQIYTFATGGVRTFELKGIVVGEAVDFTGFLEIENLTGL